ncbi:MAG TPA: cupin domain-containing protein [Gaiellaceae bacterium]|nr:cupin domain-containing protein [Gaiellaceae bacterium]
MGLSHWDDVAWHRNAKGEMDAEWQRLGDAAGTKSVGLNRVRVAPGKLPTPPHSHGASEELYYVLAGSGLAWQDGEVHEVQARDCVIHRADQHEHTFVAGPEGLEYLVFGTRHPTEIGWLPRSRAIRIGWPWAEGRDDDPWDVEATVEPLDVSNVQPRPENIRNVDEVELESQRHQTWAGLANRDDTELAGMAWERLAAGQTGSVPHSHSEEEEIFVILEGSATLHLEPNPSLARYGERPEEHALRPGHVVARPPGTGVSHWFRAGKDGCAMLVYGTRKPNDMCFYPRSNTINFRGLKVLAHVDPVPYPDGDAVE